MLTLLNIDSLLHRIALEKRKKKKRKEKKEEEWLDILIIQGF